MIFLGFAGFLSKAGIGATSGSYIFHVQKPLNDVRGIRVDSTGQIYIGDGESASIQVYSPDGVFQYGFSFPTSTGWFIFGLDENDQIHVVTARTDSHYIFFAGELVGEEHIDNYDVQAALETKYNMAEGSTFQMGTKNYRITTFRRIKITDTKDNTIIKLNLHTPIWPFSVFSYWLIAALGGVMVFISIFRVIFPDNSPMALGVNKIRSSPFSLHDEFVISTNQPPDDVLALLHGLIQPKCPNVFSDMDKQKAFWGEINRSGFKISPVPVSGNFSIVFTGKIIPAAEHTEIEVLARICTSAAVFWTLYLAFCSLLCLTCIGVIFADGFRGILLTPIIMLIFGYALIHSSFWGQEQKARPLLENIFANHVKSKP